MGEKNSIAAPLQQPHSGAAPPGALQQQQQQQHQMSKSSLSDATRLLQLWLPVPPRVNSISIFSSNAACPAYDVLFHVRYGAPALFLLLLFFHLVSLHPKILIPCFFQPSSGAHAARPLASFVPVGIRCLWASLLIPPSFVSHRMHIALKLETLLSRDLDGNLSDFEEKQNKQLTQ